MRDFIITINASGTTFQSFDDQKSSMTTTIYIPTYRIEFSRFHAC